MNYPFLRWALFAGLTVSLWAQSPVKPEAKPAPGPNFAGKIAQGINPTRSVVYKKIDGIELRIDIFEPAHAEPGKLKSAFVGIHGGGWGAGAPRAMYPFSDWGAQQGMVGFSIQYRLYKPQTENTVLKCVQDARSAVRYIRKHAADFGIDPNRIVVFGASAGGHLAVATALFDQMDEPGEDKAVSCVPDALVLFSPVIDTSAEGYGQAKVGTDWRKYSPAHQVRHNLPSTLLFHGTGDATTPYKGAVAFHEAMITAGNRCDLITVAGAQHTYMFKDAALYAQTKVELEKFLTSLGFLAKK